MERRGEKKIQRPKGNNWPPWIDLPEELTENILLRLGAFEILENARKVCTTWRSVCSKPSLWRVIHMEQSSYEAMCRRAVDLSQGELIDINIDSFVTPYLLRYVSERSSRLKRLRLGRCDYLPTQFLCASVKKFPELEELHLFFVPDMSAKYIEFIGISCPKLKSFTFNNCSYRLQRMNIDDDSCALAIAKNMPNLRHLFLIGNGLSNEGLKAIFNGCPNLESLDLRQCFRVNLQGDFGKMCSERIRYLKWDDMIYK